MSRASDWVSKMKECVESRPARKIIYRPCAGFSNLTTSWIWIQIEDDGNLLFETENNLKIIIPIQCISEVLRFISEQYGEGK